MRPWETRTRYLIEALILGVLAVAVFMPWGCSRSPLDIAGPGAGSTFHLPNGIIAYPGTHQPPVVGWSGQGFATVPLALEGDSTSLVNVFEDVVGLAGGVIAMPLGDSEVSFLTVPAGALLSETRIRADVYREQVGLDTRHTEFHFEPDGLVFRLPASLSFGTSEPEGSILLLHCWDAQAQDWLPSSQAVAVMGYATFPVLHFSDYRVTERISLGGQRSHK